MRSRVAGGGGKVPPEAFRFVLPGQRWTPTPDDRREADYQVIFEANDPNKRVMVVPTTNDWSSIGVSGHGFAPIELSMRLQ